MASRLLPLLVCNMGTEMLYVLDERLHDDSLSHDIANTTIGDIIIAMFNHRATSSLFQPQELISVKDLKNVFYKFIEASEMTLKNDSMERLYDIMIMSFKQQIKSVLVAKELLYLTHTHIKNLINLFENRNFTNKRNAIQCLTNVTRLINQSYIRKSSGEWIRIRQTLLNYLNGSNCVIKVFLESKMQDKDGNIIIQKKNISELFGKTGMIYYFQPKKTEQLFTTNDYLNIVKATDTEFYMIENVKYNIGDNLFSKRKQCTEEKNKIKPIPENDSISESSVLSHMLRKTTIKHISFENILDISETSEKQSGDGFAFKLKETQKQKYEEIKPHILQNKNDSARKIREKFSFLETQQNEQLSEIKYDLTSSQDLINLMDNFENFEDD